MIARALAHEPRLLLLDEPTAGVDIELRRSMWEFLSEMNTNGTTIILTTHYLEEAEQLCRNIAIIDEGIIIENTSLKNLLAGLDSQTFIIDSVATISKTPYLNLDNVSIRQIDEKSLEVSIPSTGSINDVFMELNRAEIKISSMRNKTNRLEQLFLSRLNESGTK